MSKPRETGMNMKENANETEALAAREEKSLVGRRTPISDSVKRACARAITRNQLKEYLFRRRAGAELPAEIEVVQEHLPYCPACQMRLAEIEDAEAFLEGEADSVPAVIVEFVDKLPVDFQREKLVAEVSRKLAAVLATPSVSFSLDDLAAMNANIRTVGNTARRRAIATDVLNACEARWRRLDGEKRESVEPAAAKLMTLISDREEQRRANEDADVSQLGITGERQARDFLLYMMTKMYFLNPDGETTWDFDYGDWKRYRGEDSSEGESIHTFPDRSIFVRIRVLREALPAYVVSEEQTSGPKRA